MRETRRGSGRWQEQSNVRRVAGAGVCGRAEEAVGRWQEQSNVRRMAGADV
jgi:hypothetical protein